MQKISSAISPIMTIDGKVVRPLRRQLYDGYRAAAVGVMLRPGPWLPSVSGLASEVGISRLPLFKRIRSAFSGRTLSKPCRNRNGGKASRPHDSPPSRVVSQDPPFLIRSKMLHGRVGGVLLASAKWRLNSSHFRFGRAWPHATAAARLSNGLRECDRFAESAERHRDLSQNRSGRTR